MCTAAQYRNISFTIINSVSIFSNIVLNKWGHFQSDCDGPCFYETVTALLQSLLNFHYITALRLTTPQKCYPLPRTAYTKNKLYIYKKRALNKKKLLSWPCRNTIFRCFFFSFFKSKNVARVFELQVVSSHTEMLYLYFDLGLFFSFNISCCILNGLPAWQCPHNLH